MGSASIVLALAIIVSLIFIDTLGIGMSQNLTQNHAKIISNISNATANNPFLNGKTPFGSAALP